MTARSETTAAAARPAPAPIEFSTWVLIAGFMALAIPTVFSLADQEWSLESGAHEPIVLALGGWLIWRQWAALRDVTAPGGWLVVSAMLLVGLPLYVFGRAYDFLTLEAAGLYGAGLAVLYARIGPVGFRKLWFPLVFLAFAVPAPHALLDAMTSPLKQFVSHVATAGLSGLGLPVARQGVTIYVAQYQLLVEDACSGMNSLVGLVAITLLYVYLSRGPSLFYAILLAASSIPIAIIANILRIAILILITYYFGNDAGQGFLHFAAGIVLFSTALLFVFLIDKALLYLLGRRPKQREA